MESGTDARPVKDLIVFAQTDTGQARQHNEDSFLVHRRTSQEAPVPEVVWRHDFAEEPLLLAVSDGMGGAAAGEVASRIAVETIRSYFDEAAPQSAKQCAAHLERSLHEANEAVRRQADAHEGRQGMGATATAVLLFGRKAYVGQIGDSRAYVYRSGTLQQVTRDQSLVGMLVEAGELTPREAAEHPQRNVVLQALGTQTSLKPAIAEVDLRSGDILLLCSDGLSGCVEDDEVGAVLESIPDLREACAELIRRANARGGPDNITVVIGRVEADWLPKAGGGAVKVKPIKAFRAGAEESSPGAALLPDWLLERLPLQRATAALAFLIIALALAGWLVWG